jgi:hypothetical protein
MRLRQGGLASSEAQDGSTAFLAGGATRKHIYRALVQDKSPERHVEDWSCGVGDLPQESQTPKCRGFLWEDNCRDASGLWRVAGQAEWNVSKQAPE